jgi:hypothetical protein
MNVYAPIHAVVSSVVPCGNLNERYPPTIAKMNGNRNSAQRDLKPSIAIRIVIVNCPIK